MFRDVAVPLWLFILILLFAAVTFASHFLFPSVRWFFRRRAERVVATLNERLTRPIEPFKLVRRYDTIGRLIYDPKVIAAVAETADEEQLPRNVVHERARRYAREIVPSFSASAYFGFGTRAARYLSRLLYKIRVDISDEAGLAAIPPDATVIFVINHRSNMDYVLVTYLAAERSTTLSYAVGEWAQVWPLSALIRSMGAYFIRRRSRGQLYRRVLASYVQIATAEGVTQAVFPEGGLSLDGRVGAPKLGILSYVIDADTPRDVWFVPVAVNYDRVIEDRFLLAALRTGKRRFEVPVMRAVGYVLRRMWQKLRGRFLRYGYAAVTFGSPLSLSEFRKDVTGDLPAAVGAELMDRIRSHVPAVPVPILSSVLMETPDISRADLAEAFQARVQVLRDRGAHVHVPRGAPGEAIRLALDHLVMRGLLQLDGERIKVAAGAEPILAYYAASIEHLWHDAPVEGEILSAVARS